jgi:hypothetical protein
MAIKRAYKKQKRGTPQFVMLYNWMIDSEAWLDLKAQPRALYLLIKRRFNGSNNGEIYLSHREAAKLLNMHRNSIGTYFDVLIEHGFLKQTTKPHLGPSGVGQSAKWELTELPVNNRPATKEFMRWTKK